VFTPPGAFIGYTTSKIVLYVFLVFIIAAA
jgi:hypothetical protein